MPETFAPETILIVDDTPDNLRLLSQMLSERGYGVRAVTSGPRALESARATPPHLVLLDIRMPEMDGFEVCQQLKADPRTHDLPVVFVSALNDVEDKVRGFGVGGVDFVTKPFQVEEVLARVQTHLAVRRLQKQLQEANRRYEEELALAGDLQSSFLPRQGPELPGWEILLALKPARETSGDFYDLVPLPDGRLGILIADVVDKGAAAALVMAMAWSLFRNFAGQFPDQPERVLGAVNDALVVDARGSRFVTSCYAVLDPSTGDLAYCNAGHPPPLLVSFGNEIQPLGRTGPLLGMLSGHSWGRGAARLKPGDLLVLYTDGVTEAQNVDGELYGHQRLAESLAGLASPSASAGMKAVLNNVERFTAGAPQTDDIALVAVARSP